LADNIYFEGNAASLGLTMIRRFDTLNEYTWHGRCICICESL